MTEHTRDEDPDVSGQSGTDAWTPAGAERLLAAINNAPKFTPGDRVTVAGLLPEYSAGSVRSGPYEYTAYAGGTEVHRTGYTVRLDHDSEPRTIAESALTPLDFCPSCGAEEAPGAMHEGPPTDDHDPDGPGDTHYSEEHHPR